jgi:putative oxidoreductase
MKALSAIVLAVVGLLFVWAGTVKVLDPWTFLRGVEQFGVFPRFTYGPVAVIVPVAEILTGLLVWLPRGRRVGALLAMGFGTIFAALFLAAGAMDREVACGCFGGAAEPTNSLFGFARALVLVLAAAWIYGRAFTAALCTRPE